MNDIERAIEYLQNSLCDQKQGETHQELHNDMLNIAISALEKQVAKKPKDGSISTKAGVIGANCICGRIIFGGELYCKRCGQKLDWSEVENE